MKENVVKPVYDGKSLLHWLYTRNLKEIFEINTTLRIEMKLPEFKDFNLTNELIKELFPEKAYDIAGTNPSALKNQQLLMKEKIGLEIIGNDHNLFSMPVFELKETIPNSATWFNFFVNVDKKSYFEDDNFFKIDKNIQDLKNVNTILFPNKMPSSENCISYYFRLLAFSLSSESSKRSQVITKEEYLSTYWWNIEGKFYTLQEIVDATEDEEQKGKILAALTPESLQSFIAPSLNFQEQNDGPEPRFYIRDLKNREKKPLFFNAIMGGTNEQRLQYIDIANKRFKSFDNAEINPFIAIDPLLNYGAFTILDGEDQPASYSTNHAKNLEKMLPGSEFDYDHAFNWNYPVRPPIGSIRPPVPPSEGQIQKWFETIEKAAYILIGKEGLKRKWRYRNEIRAIANLIDPGRYPYYFPNYNLKNVGGMQLQLATPLQANIDQAGEPGGPSRVEDFIGYEIWGKWTMQDVINGLSLYELGRNGLAVEYGIVRNIGTSAASDDFDFGGIEPGFERTKSALMHITKAANKQFSFATQSYEAVKGGTAGTTTQVIEKEIFDGTPAVNVYDLFSLMLKKDVDKKVFDRILKSFFIKEQTTIISIIHRMLSEAHYPEVKESFNPVLSSCFETMLSEP